MINNQTLVEEISGQFGEKVRGFEENSGILSFVASPEDLLDIVSFLKEHSVLKFNFLTDITGIHFPDNEGAEFCSLYMLHSWENRIRVRIRVFLSKDNLEVPSLTPIFKGADWMEREAFDFYGIIYTGHPNLKRILNMEDMDYHPMRKEYALEDPTRRDKIDDLFGR
ncbi:NADH-quinone oxidoreductase subunit C [Leadbetterella byssophila]|uniref:NADH-quinone oxidoreductase subunit C n=1 Tax=Leadbetterella byssophila TaxID=316068 RepID=UPI00399F395E